MAHIKYVLLSILTFFTYAKAAQDLTHYIAGGETIINGSKAKVTSRSDSIIIGGAGGFHGYTPPSPKCTVLYINFSCSADAVEPNTMLTSFPSFPPTVQEIWLQGDARGYDTLVQNGAEFALPDPATETIVRFNLSNAPTTSPRSWFKTPSLAAGCWLCIEPFSQDPHIDNVLPINGAQPNKPSRVMIGSRVTPSVGFTVLLAGAVSPVYFQRHPNLPYHDSYLAPLTLQEETTFYGHVNGLSLDWVGDLPEMSDSSLIKFMLQTDIVNPTAEAGLAGFFIASNRVLQIYDANKTGLPLLKQTRGAGGASNIEVEVLDTPEHKKSPLSPVMIPQRLPITKFPTY